LIVILPVNLIESLNVFCRRQDVYEIYAHFLTQHKLGCICMHTSGTHMGVIYKCTCGVIACVQNISADLPVTLNTIQIALT